VTQRGFTPMKRAVQQASLAAYRALARTGLLKQAWAWRLFLAMYSPYKIWIEAGPVDQLKDFIVTGSTVVDVGANVGFFTLRFASWVGEQGHVIAIEPDVHNFRTLAAKIDGAGLQRRVRLHQAAAAAAAGSLRLKRNELHPGDHRITLGGEGIAVPAVTVDDVVAAAGAKRVSLVKIDVQGAEMLVLAGAKRTLDTMRPALFVEVDDRALRSFGSSARALVALVESAGYDMYELAGEGSPQKLSRERFCARLKRGSYSDVLFLPASDQVMVSPSHVRIGKHDG
jgi:FkbM family methyltransferase